ncbi:MAG: hypothetical protein HUU38_31975 [Anaerolineales bacterium]|nr:hypothetical protein [Anaerolineales bacterium]
MIAPATGAEVTLEEESNRWEERTALSFARAGQATAVIGEQVILIGGETADGIIATTESYDVKANLWTMLSDKPTAVSEVQATVLGGKIYVPGGKTATGEITDILEIFDPSQNVWTEGPALPVKLSAYGLVSFEGKLYLFGGWDGEKYTDFVLTYSPDLEQWAEVAQLPSPRGFVSAVVVTDRIYILGGYNGKEPLESNLIFLPGRANGTSPWDNAAPLPGGRYAMGVAFIGDRIYVMGGIQENGKPAPQLIFLPANDGWIVRSDPNGEVPPTWSHFGVAVVGASVYALGGILDSQPTNQNIAFQAIYTVPLPLIIK